jgi:ectoine hydroxylase-related dioxygenase (phytanoyl-CoA dioxygenase family)
MNCRVERRLAETRRQRRRSRAAHAAAGPARLQARYELDGYVVVRNFFSRATIDALSRSVDRLLVRCKSLIRAENLRCRWQSHAVSGECLFDGFDPVCDLSRACAAVASHGPLLDLLGGIYGEPACRFKDKLIYKPPGAKGYGLHQDFIAWRGFPRSFLTVVVPIDDADEHNGCIEVFAHGDRSGCLGAEDGDYHELPAEVVDERRAVKLTMQAGDIAIFGGFMPHRSGANRSDRSRRQLYLSYNAMSDGGAQRERHYQQFLLWLAEKYARYGRTGVYFK